MRFETSLCAAMQGMRRACTALHPGRYTPLPLHFFKVTMNPSGKCPKCEKPVDRLVIVRVEAGADMGGSTHRALTLQCPSCQTVLGAQLVRSFDNADVQSRGINEEQGTTSH